MVKAGLAERVNGRKELRSLGGGFQFRLDRNRSGDDSLPIRYVSAYLDSAGSRHRLGACLHLGTGTIREICSAWGGCG